MYGGGAHAALISFSFQVFSSTVKTLFGIGRVAAVDDEVKTKLLTVGCLAAEFKMPLMLWTVGVMTSFGFGENEISDATWAIPETPT